ncbi:MAG: HAD hydrolase family protein [Candidatus Omnitrophica bacterium]|nr:HAD hydrolase family protein [Candidatus Omnitrophota bacterium]
MPLLKSPKLIVFDFDGVFTDNGVLVHEDGSESVFCSRADGLGISLLAAKGILMVVLSTEENPVVSARSKKLGLPCYQGVRDKFQALKALLEEKRIDAEDVVYVGNDINDLKCMEWVGCGVAVKDAEPAVLAKAKVVLKKEGGRGAVRELCDLVMQESSHP